MARSLIHCAHPIENLIRTQCPGGECTCDLCLIRATGLHYYRCQACNFDVHECCVVFPRTISFFAHPGHDLHLIRTPDPRNPRQCDFCKQLGGLLFYSCISCGFNVHPHCSMAKQIVRSDIHAGHDLSLVRMTSVCNACNISDEAWFYRCHMGCVSFHTVCLDGLIVPNPSHYYSQSNTQQIMHSQDYSSSNPIVPSMNHYCGQTNTEQIRQGPAYNISSPIVPNVSPYAGQNSGHQQMMYCPAHNVSSNAGYSRSNGNGTSTSSNVVQKIAIGTIAGAAGNLLADVITNLF